ncbi:MAG: tandem-95 repeat protein, partial [bacterium]
ISSIATFTATDDSNGIFTAVFKVVDPCGASASDTIQVTITPVNDPPVLAAVPGLRFDEDKSLLHPISNWYPFVADKDNVDSTLTFAVQAGKNVKAARQAGNFRFSAPANWFGNDTLQLIVKDLGQLADTTALMVTVNPINDAPKISGLPDSLSFKKGASAQLKIWDFVEDVETPDSLLTYGFSANIPSLRLNFNPALRGMLTLTAPQFHGSAKLFVNINDGKAGARDTINVTVIFVNDPPVISAIPGLTFDEDKSLLYPLRNWYPFITDKDHADSTLAFAVVSGRKVSAVKQGNDFLFSAPPNWFGKDTLQLTVTDPGKLANTTVLLVTVNPVNDAPKIAGLPDSLVFKKGGSAQLKLWDYIEDIETPDRQLAYTFSTSITSLQRNFNHATGVLVLTSPQFHGRAQLFINVSDSKAGAQDTIAVRVELPTGVASGEPSLPTAFHLWPNSPNPFNPGTTIRFDTPHAGRAKLAVYTLHGELVQTLVDGEMAAGAHQIHFDGRNLASGIYFYRMETDSYVMTRKMLLQK